MTATLPRLDAHVEPASGSPVLRSRWHAFVRGRTTDPAYVRPALLGLLTATALLYLWRLGDSGWANSFYTAAVQAGTKSWKAFLFGSFDSSNFITVDKPPASLWVMELSARLFGLNAWSVLVPQALEGVVAVGLLYATVRRQFSASAALLAGAVMALTPVAALMFRYNNPDALLVLLLVAAAYALVRALESASGRWLVVSAVLVGTGFVTKMLQALIVVPIFAGVYLLTAPTTFRRRFLHLVAAGVGLLVSSGWWVAIVELTPASARPYIGGSQNNSLLDLIFGYNGFGRITGNETGSVGGGAAGTAGRWGATGLTRMFNGEFGGQVSWLIPAALVLLAAMLWLSRRVSRGNQQRAQVLVWGGWLVLTGLVFSYARGIIHPYYAVALAPAIGALVGIGAASLWPHRRQPLPRVSLAAALGATAWWSAHLLGRTPTWHPVLRGTILVVGLGLVVAVFAAPYLSRRLAVVVASAGLVVTLAGPAAYAASTAATPHTGAIPSAGPSGISVGGGLGPVPGAVRRQPPGPFNGGLGGFRGFGGFGGQAHPQAGGFLDAQRPSATVVRALQEHAAAYTWVAATIGANNAAGYQLSSGHAVMAIGGFNGSDPAPTLAEFVQLVRAGKIHYFIASAGFGGGFGAAGSSVGSQITQWVEQNFTSTTVGGTVLYDLTRVAASN